MFNCVQIKITIFLINYKLMGVIDEYKQEKNKKIIITASKKMIEDKYKINIDDKDLLIIINNIITSICNDAMLMKNIS